MYIIIDYNIDEIVIVMLQDCILFSLLLFLLQYFCSYFLFRVPNSSKEKSSSPEAMCSILGEITQIRMLSSLALHLAFLTPVTWIQVRCNIRCSTYCWDSWFFLGSRLGFTSAVIYCSIVRCSIYCKSRLYTYLRPEDEVDASELLGALETW